MVLGSVVGVLMCESDLRVPRIHSAPDPSVLIPGTIIIITVWSPLLSAYSQTFQSKTSSRYTQDDRILVVLLIFTHFLI